MEELSASGWSEADVRAFLRGQFDLQSRAYRTAFPGGKFELILSQDKSAGRIYTHQSIDEIRLIDLALMPDFRGQGIGTALLTSLLAEATQSGRPVRFHVERMNRALRLYERLGFRVIGENGPYHLMEHQPDATES